MPLRAELLLPLDPSDVPGVDAPAEVLLFRDGFQVVRVHALAVAAAVVNLEASRDRSFGQNVGNPMRVLAASAGEHRREPAVAVSLANRPREEVATGSCVDDNQLPEPFTKGFKLVH
jgi:hypothetical protein